MPVKRPESFLFLLFFAAFSTTLSAQNWYRDSTFGTTGAVWTGTSQADDQIRTALLLPDGGLLIASQLQAAGTSTLTRITASGEPDHSFGVAGKISQSEVYWSALAVQPDGKILAAGQRIYAGDLSSNIFRLLPDGTPDSTFDSDGIAEQIFDDFYYQAVSAIAVLPDGRILVSGIAQDNGSEQHFRLTRLHPDGSRDQDFGQTGFAGFSFLFDTYQLDHLLLQPDGKIIVGGNWKAGTNRDFVLLRYLPDGTPDPGFGTNGKVRTDLNFGFDDFISQLLLYPDGRILAAGGLIANAHPVPAMARYLPSGTPDPEFGQGGKTVFQTAVPLLSGFGDLRLQTDNSLLAILRRYDPDTRKLSLWIKRLLPGGIPDTTGNADTYLLDSLDEPVAYWGARHWTADGRLLQTGSGTPGGLSEQDLFLLRYRFDGVLTDAPAAGPVPLFQLQLSPNPGRGAALLRGQASAQVRGVLRICAAQGTTMLQLPVALEQHAALEWPLPQTAAWPAGVYFWQFISAEGARTAGCWSKIN